MESEEVRGPFLGLLRSAVTSEQAAAMLREFLTEGHPGAGRQGRRCRGPGYWRGRRPGPGLGCRPGPCRGRGPGQAAGQAGWSSARPSPPARLLGLALTRYVLALGPVATASPDDLAAAIGRRWSATDGDVRAPGDGG